MKTIRYILLMIVVAMTAAGCETMPTRPFIPNKDLPNNGTQTIPDDEGGSGGAANWQPSQTGISVCRLNPSDKEATGYFYSNGREIGIKVEIITDVATVTTHKYCPVDIHCYEVPQDGMIPDNINTFLGTHNVLIGRSDEGKIVPIRLYQRNSPPYKKFTIKFKLRQPTDGAVTSPVQLIVYQQGSW